MSDQLGVGVIGAGWIARAHGLAIRTLPHLDPLGRPVRITMLAARGREKGEAMARHLEVDRFTTDWRELVEDPAVDVVANLTAVGGHREASEAALALGKPVLCEKPLGVDRFEAASMAAAAARAATSGVQAVTGFNYRYMPAMRLAREIALAGALGRILHFRATYLQDYALVATKAMAPNGSRAVPDYAHIIDFVRYLGCEVAAVQATAAKLTATGPDVEDAYVAAVDLRGGGIGSLEASRVARGWKGRQVVELNGTDGALWWNMEDLNHLHVFYGADEAAGMGGFRDILVTQADHPSMRSWWTPGHGIGWEHGFIHQWHDFASAVIEGRPVPAHQATFEDGYQATLICDAILASARDGRRVTIDEMTASVAAGPGS